MENRKLILEKVQTHILQQVSSTQAVDELKKLGPNSFDWNERVLGTINFLLPKLVEIAPAIVADCIAPFNSPNRLMNHLQSDIPAKAISELNAVNPELAMQLFACSEAKRPGVRSKPAGLPEQSRPP